MISFISNIFYSPIKSLSFLKLKKCYVQNNKGILNDRLFAFSRNISLEDARDIEKFPKLRKLNNFITLKNSPKLNKYNFDFYENNFILRKKNNVIISISSNNYEDYYKIGNKLNNLEKSLSRPIYLLKNKDHPFFDTTNSNDVLNSISLININSIIDLQKKSGHEIEFQRFRGNFYINEIEAWEERKWLHKIIKINDLFFKVEKHIRRCSATNLKPNSDKSTINLPMTLKKIYNHMDMGIYLTPLQDGEIRIGDKVCLDV